MNPFSLAIKRSLFLVAIFVTHTVAVFHQSHAQIITGSPSDLGLPFALLYGSNANAKAGFYDLQAFEGKLYISHGSSDNRILHKILHFDPRKNSGVGGFGEDFNTEGQSYGFNEERTGRIFVYNNQIHLLGYDPFRPSSGPGSSGPLNSKVYRLDNDRQWRAYDITGDAHNNFFGFINGRYFVTYGLTNISNPGIWATSTLGTLAAPVAMTNPVAGDWAVYRDIFTHKGSVYSTTGKTVGVNTPTAQSWLIRYNPTSQTFDNVLGNATELLGPTVGSTNPVISQPIELPSGRLVFSTRNSLGFADNLVAGGATLRNPAPAGALYLDIDQIPGGLLAFAQTRTFVAGNNFDYTKRFFFSTDGSTWDEVASFTQRNNETLYAEYLDGHVYLAGNVYTSFVQTGDSFQRFAFLYPSLTGTHTGGQRTNHTGNVGYEFTPTKNITVSALGRPEAASGGMNQNHVVRIWRVSSKAQIAAALVKPNSAKDERGNRYEVLTSPKTLLSGVKYRITSGEFSGASDKWLDQSAGNLSGHTPDVTIDGPVFSNGSGYPDFKNDGQPNAGFAAPVLYQ